VLSVSNGIAAVDANGDGGPDSAAELGSLGFTDEDRVENIRRVAEVAKLMVDAGLIVLVSFISPFRSERRMARDLVDQSEWEFNELLLPLFDPFGDADRALAHHLRRQLEIVQIERIVVGHAILRCPKPA